MSQSRLLVSSYSEPQRLRRMSMDSVEDKQKAKSAVTSVVMGALVRGFLGYKASKGNKLTCIAGAAVGAFSARKNNKRSVE